MKKIIVAFVVCLVISFANNTALAQPEFKTINGVQLIVPTLEILESYAKMSLAEWMAEMKRYGFISTDEKTHKPVFTKGNIGETILAICKDSKLGIVSFTYYNFESKESLVSNLVKVLKPNFHQRADDIRMDYYIYKAIIVGIRITDTDNQSEKEESSINRKGLGLEDSHMYTEEVFIYNVKK